MTAWEQAACVGHDPELFFADTKNAWDKDARKLAAALCRGCPVRQGCLDAALAVEGNAVAKSRAGIVGGLTPTQRANLRRVAS